MELREKVKNIEEYKAHQREYMKNIEKEKNLHILYMTTQQALISVYADACCKNRKIKKTLQTNLKYFDNIKKKMEYI